MHRNRARSLVVIVLVMWLLGVAVVSGEASPPGVTVPLALRVSYSEIGYVTSILADGAVLWVGTHSGELVRLDTATDEQTRSPYPKANVPLRALTRDSRGNIWAATEGGGLGRFDGQTWTTYDPDNSDFPSNVVRAVALDYTERLWAATDAGVCYLDGEKWVTYNTGNSGLVSDNVTALVVGLNVWCGTDNGLSLFSGKQWTTYQTTNSSLPDNHITALAQDRQGGLWIGTETGASRKAYSSWQAYPGINGPVRAILIDGADHLWFNLGQTVGQLSDCAWSTYDSSVLNVKATEIAAIALDARGRLWAGAEGGLSRLETRAEQGQWTATDITQPVRAVAVRDDHVWAGLADGGAVDLNTATGEQVTYGAGEGLTAEVRSLAVDGQGRVWSATWGHGAAVLDQGRWSSPTGAKLPTNYVNAVAASPAGAVWLGTTAGIAAFDGATWHTYSKAETGLKDERILAASTAPDGRLAFGTYGSGVALYDGQKWTLFSKSNSAIPSDYVQAVAFGPQEQLWIGTQGGGVARFDGTRWTAYPSGPAGPGGDFIYALAVDAQGSLWVGAEDGGLSQFDGCGWTHYDLPDSGPNPTSVYAVAVDRAGKVWAGTDRGLLTFIPPPPYPAEVPPPLQKSGAQTATRVSVIQRAVAQAQPDTDQWISHAVGKSVHHIAFADGVAWAATLGGGAIRWNLQDGSFTRFVYPQDGIGSNRVVYVTIDPQGRVWCATQDHGVSVYDGQKWTVYDTTNSGLSNNSVNHIAFDSQGRIWFATLNGGVCVFDGQKWTVYNHSNSGLAGDFVWTVAVDAQGQAWFGCMDGLSVFDGQKWFTYPDTNNVHCIAFDAEGRTWFGDGYGINRVEGTGVVKIGRDESGEYKVYTRDVYAMSFDAQGNAWLGTYSGIYRFDGENFSLLTTETTGLAGRQVYAASTDPQGRLWFGTDGDEGIASFDGQSWRVYRTSAGPNPLNTSVADILADRQGRVWLASGGHGVSVYDGRAWTGYTPDNSGLANGEIQAIAQDPQGRIWFGTSKGIRVFDGTRWETIDPANSGLLDENVRGIWFDPQGRAWIGSEGGVSLFDGKTWRTFSPKNSPVATGDISSLAVDKQGRVWMTSSWANTVYILDGERWTQLQSEEYGMKGIFGSVIITVDPQGHIWLGSDSGLSVFDGQTWTTHSLKEIGLDTFSISAMVFDRAGRLWVGSYGGVARLDGSSWTVYTPENSPLPDRYVQALTVDLKGHVWMGVSQGGATEMIPGSKRFPMPPTPAPTATRAPAKALLAPSPTPPAKRIATPPPTATRETVGLAPAGPFAGVWEKNGGSGGALGWALAPARQVFCADQRYEQGYMFWRNNDPAKGAVYVLNYGNAQGDSGRWQAFPDTFSAGQPERGGFAPPPDRFEPVRGFGQVWREKLGGGPNAPPIGWALEDERGSDQYQYEDFQRGAMLYSPRLKQVYVLLQDGTWRAFPSE